MDWIRRQIPKGGTNIKPLLKREIEIAQKNTRSAAEAARYLGTSYNTYKKYAKLYGIFDQHKNPSGKGIPRPHVHGRYYSMDDILAGKHPSYDLKKLKERLFKTAIKKEECEMCGMSEKRVTDQRSPLMLVFKDGDSTNHKLENLQILCYNCTFLTAGNLNRVNVKIKKDMKEDIPVVRTEEVPLSDDELKETIAEAKKELEQE